MFMPRIVAAALTFALCRIAAADTLAGQIDDPSIRRKADLVYVEQTDLKAPLAASAVMGQRGNTYRPHILPVVAGTTVTFKSDDPELHNIFARLVKRVLFTEAVLPAGHFEKLFKEPGVVHLTCNIHKEMSAYVVVLQNGFFAIPDKNTGAFTINGLPPGSYTIRVWGEALSDEQNAKKYTGTSGGKAPPLHVATL